VSFSACIARRSKVFSGPDRVDPVVEMLRVAVEDNSCFVPAYCFMPDHVHLLISGRLPTSDIKRAMDAFKYESGHWFLRNAAGVEWQRNYYDHVIRHTESLSNHVVYTLNNPVRAGLVDHWNDYPFSGSIGVDLVEYLRDLEESVKFGGLHGGSERRRRKFD